MRTTSLLAAIVAMAGFGACAVDDQPPTDDPSSTVDPSTPPETVQVPKELSFDQLSDGAITNLNGCGTLVYCADPRWSPHLPSFCTKAKAGCNNDKAFADAISLCHSVCAPSVCGGSYYVLGPC